MGTAVGPRDGFGDGSAEGLDVGTLVGTAVSGVFAPSPSLAWRRRAQYKSDRVQAYPTQRTSARDAFVAATSAASTAPKNTASSQA